MTQGVPPIEPEVPNDFDVDEDPYTDEDGRGDDVDQPLPDLPVEEGE